ncbi:ankyrin repeat domain-containing protein [Breznakiellaceae bacterium SP9]
MQDDKSLLYACVINDMDLIKERLNNVSPAQLKKSTMETGTPLHAAVMNENKEAAAMLIAAGADMEAGNFLKNNAMLAGIEAGKLDMAKYLLEKGSNINKKGCQNRNALSLLILYSWNRDFAEYLLNKGCDINHLSIDKQSLLSDGASANNEDALGFLLEHGISRSFLNSALCWAIIHNSVDAVKLLLDKGADLDEMYASCKGIEKGLYHTTATGENRTALLKLLISRGVDFKKAPERAVVVDIDKSKLSPLDYAKEHFQKWPDAQYIMENINTIEQMTQ